MDLWQHQVGDEWISASRPAWVRSGGRRNDRDRCGACAARGRAPKYRSPLERAPWAVRALVVTSAAYREGVARFVAGPAAHVRSGRSARVASEGTE